MAESSNFAFLRAHDLVFLQLATTVEQVSASAPNTTLIKLCQLGEALAIWYHQSFGKSGSAFKAGAFATPAASSAPLCELQGQIDQFRLSSATPASNWKTTNSWPN